MKQYALSFFENTDLTLIGFILFLITFTGIVLWVFRKGGKSHYKRMSELPLEGDKK